MTIVESGMGSLLEQFGEEVIVRKNEDSSPEDDTDPIFFDEGQEDVDSTKETVRLYTSLSTEDLQEYGFDETAETVMWADEDIADLGDTVEYEPLSKEWNVDDKTTNQHGNGPYIFIYSLS